MSTLIISIALSSSGMSIAEKIKFYLNEAMSVITSLGSMFICLCFTAKNYSISPVFTASMNSFEMNWGMVRPVAPIP
jgi:hypothetical protein